MKFPGFGFFQLIGELADRYFDDPEVNPLPPSEPAPSPSPRKLRAAMTCEACGCDLAADGSVLRRGEVHGEYLGQKDVITRLTRERDEALTKVADLERAARERESEHRKNNSWF